MAVGRKRNHPLISSGVFNALVEMSPKMTAAQIEMARMVMVEGRTMEWAGKHYNCTCTEQDSKPDKIEIGRAHV